MRKGITAIARLLVIAAVTLGGALGTIMVANYFFDMSIVQGFEQFRARVKDCTTYDILYDGNCTRKNFRVTHA